MKTKVLLLLAVFLCFSIGCKKKPQTTTKNITTEFTVNQPITIIVGQALKSVPTYTFTQTNDLNLSDNADVKSYVSNITSITINSGKINITGLTGTQAITAVSVKVDGTEVFTANNITATNNNPYSATLSADAKTMIVTKLKTNKKVSVTISGSANGQIVGAISIVGFGASVQATVPN